MTQVRVNVRCRLTHFDLAAEFVIDPGVTVLFGPSGSGKTTLLDLISGVRPPDISRGDFARVGFKRVDDQRSEERGETLKPPSGPGSRTSGPDFGYVFQSAALFPAMTASENVGYGLFKLPRIERQPRVAELLKRFGIAHLAAKRARELSGGEQQLVALARTLIISPRVLLLDEPFSALDHARKAETLELLRSIVNERRLPVLYVTHAIDEALTIADRVLRMREGKIVAQGDPEEMLRPERDAMLTRLR